MYVRGVTTKHKLVSICEVHAETSLLCSTLVRNTVVRATLQAYGKWWISTPWGAETAEPIEMKLGMGDYVGDRTPHAQNEKCT